MHKLSGAILVFFSLTACTLTPLHSPDYSKMQQDAFTKVFKQVRGNTIERLSDLEVGRKLSKALVKGKGREEIESLFSGNDGVCTSLYSNTLMNCTVTRFWTYTGSSPSSERDKNCEPGMQLLYSFYFYEPGKPPETTPKFDFKALHLHRCPGDVPLPVGRDPSLMSGIPEF